MFEALESRQFFSVAPVAPAQSQRDAPPSDQVSIDATASKSGGKEFLTFKFETVRTTKIDWSDDD